MDRHWETTSWEWWRVATSELTLSPRPISPCLLSADSWPRWSESATCLGLRRPRVTASWLTSSQGPGARASRNSSPCHLWENPWTWTARWGVWGPLLPTPSLHTSAPTRHVPPSIPYFHPRCPLPSFPSFLTKDEKSLNIIWRMGSSRWGIYAPPTFQMRKQNHNV